VNAVSTPVAAVDVEDLVACEATDGRLYSVVSIDTLSGLVALTLGRIDAGVIDMRVVVLDITDDVLVA